MSKEEYEKLWTDLVDFEITCVDADIFASGDLTDLLEKFKYKITDRLKQIDRYMRNVLGTNKDYDITYDETKCVTMEAKKTIAFTNPFHGQPIEFELKKDINNEDA